MGEFNWQHFVEQSIRQAGWQVECAGHQLQLTSLGNPEISVSISVLNLMASIREHPESARELSTAFIRSALSSLSQSQEQRLIIRLLRPSTELQAPWSRPLIEGRLHLALAMERDYSFRLLSPMAIVSTGQSLQQLQQTALNELRMQPVVWDCPQPGVWILEGHDGLSAAQLLWLDQLLELEEAWVGVPTRDHLWVCSSLDVDPVFPQRVRTAHHQGAYPLMEHCFRWRATMSRAWREP